GAIRRHRMTAELRHAIDDGQLRLHYQPEVDLVTGATVAVEALVRWEHPELGLVPPLDFIGVAEDTGLIVDLGMWVLETACRQAVVWGRSYDELATITMAVNVSGRQLPNDDDAGSIVWTITSLGHRLGMRVIAEGIETAAQLTALESYGCDLAQGFHLARPAPAEDILPVLLGAPCPQSLVRAK